MIRTDSVSDNKGQSDNIAQLCSLLLRIGTEAAQRHGYANELLQDCAASFVLRVLSVRERRKSPVPGTDEALLRHWANQFVIDFSRMETRRSRHESVLSDRVDRCHERSAPELTDPSPTPEMSAMRKEFWKRVCRALLRLSPRHMDLLVMHHLEGKSVGEISQVTGRSAHAEEESLYRARRRARHLLQQAGLSEEVLRSYVALLLGKTAEPMIEGRPNRPLTASTSDDG